MSAAPDLAVLRGCLEVRFGTAILPIPGAPIRRRRDGLRLGVASLDSLLPEGLPRGELSLWVGEATADRTALLRATVAAAVADRLWVAVVDAAGALAADAWCTSGGPLDRLCVVRAPADARPEEGAWAAEQLLETGAFDLVVLHGVPGLDSVRGQRLRARDVDAALVVVSDGTSDARPDLRLICATRSVRSPRVGPAGTRVGSASWRWSGTRRTGCARPSCGRIARPGRGGDEVLREPLRGARSHARQQEALIVATCSESRSRVY